MDKINCEINFHRRKVNEFKSGVHYNYNVVTFVQHEQVVKTLEWVLELLDERGLIIMTELEITKVKMINLSTIESLKLRFRRREICDTVLEGALIGHEYINLLLKACETLDCRVFIDNLYSMWISLAAGLDLMREYDIDGDVIQGQKAYLMTIYEQL